MRLIDADAMRQEWLENGENEYVYDTNVILDSIDRQLTIDQEDLRPKGKWIEKQCQTYLPVEYDDFGEPILHNFVVYHCDQCGRMERKKEPYCNCGAKMEV